MSQRIAVLASGPSLPTYWSDDKFDEYETVIGVNSVCKNFKTTWAVSIDTPMLEAHVRGDFVRPTVGFVSSRTWKDHIALLGRQYREIPGVLVGCHWSFCNALFFANSMERDSDFQIDVYGFDCAINKPDFTTLASNHSEDRFSRELVWIRAAWRNNSRVFSQLRPEVYDWLAGKTKNLVL